MTAHRFYRARGRFIRRRDYQDIGLAYIIERSPDLQTWTDLGNGTRRVLDDDYEWVTFNRILSGKPANHFSTLRIEYNPPE